MTEAVARHVPAPAAPPSRREAFGVWARIGVLSFGGPAAQIALMHRYLVEEKGWLDERRFLSALSFCMLLPGPEAMQLATYAGWRLHGVRGGLVAGLLFVVPGACVVLALAVLYATLGGTGLVELLFFGARAAVLVIVVQALLRVAGRALKTTAHRALAAFAFVALFFLALPYPLVILVAAIVGFTMLGDDDADTPATSKDETTSTGRTDGPDAGANPNAVPSSANADTSVAFAGTLATIALWLAVWWLPVFALDALTSHDILGELARFFSTLAVVTFGGAYAVLAYLAQDIVTNYG